MITAEAQVCLAKQVLSSRWNLLPRVVVCDGSSCQFVARVQQLPHGGSYHIVTTYLNDAHADVDTELIVLPEKLIYLPLLLQI